jgi:hypothetical protein
LVLGVGDAEQHLVDAVEGVQAGVPVALHVVLGAVHVRVHVFFEVLLLLTTASKGAPRRALHAQLKVILEDATPGELGEMLIAAGPNLGIFWERGGWENAEMLRERVPELSLTAKISILEVVSRHMRAIPPRNYVGLVREVFFATRGEELTILKNAVDSGGDYHNLYKLIYQDIPGRFKKVRTEILMHIAKEAKRAKRQDPHHYRMKVVSDIDDTLWSSAGHFPAGVDSRFPRHCFYPGVFALHREIASGPGSEMLVHLTQRALDLQGSPPSPSVGGESSQGSSESDDITSHSLGQSNDSTPAGVTNPRERVLCIAGVEREKGEVRLKVGLEERLKDIWVRMTEITHAPIHSLTFALGNIGRKLATSYPDHSLVLLSARPKVKAAKGFFESIMYRKFSKLYQSGQISSMPTLLPGSFSVSSRAMMFGILEKMGIVDTAYVWRSVAHKKAKDLGRYMDLYPECDFVFFGDNGQGDEQTALEVLGSGRTLLRSSGARLVAGFIHDVEKPRKEKLKKKLQQDLKDSDKISDKMTKILSYLSPRGPDGSPPLKGISPMRRSKSAQALSSIHTFGTYIDAAVEAFHLELISLNGLYNVAHEAADDTMRLLRRSTFKHKKWRAEFAQRLVDDTNRSIDMANKVLPEDLQIAMLPPVERIHLDSGTAYVAGSQTILANASDGNLGGGRSHRRTNSGPIHKRTGSWDGRDGRPRAFNLDGTDL